MGNVSGVVNIAAIGQFRMILGHAYLLLTLQVLERISHVGPPSFTPYAILAGRRA